MGLEIFYQIIAGTGFQIDEVLRRWSQTQFEDVRSQLELGARTLDLRFGYEVFSKSWRVVHGMAYGSKAIPILEEVNAFLNDHPTELVVLHAREIINATPEVLAELVETCQRIFGDKVYSPEDNWRDRTVGELVDSNHRVFLVFWDPDWPIYEKYPFVWNNNQADYFFNTYADADTYDSMSSFNRSVIDQFKSLGRTLPKEKTQSAAPYNTSVSKGFGEGNLILTSWTQTPNAWTIARSLKEGTFIGTWEMSLQARNGFPEFYQEMKLKYDYPIFGNIFIMDYLDQETSETIIRPLTEF